MMKPLLVASAFALAAPAVAQDMTTDDMGKPPATTTTTPQTPEMAPPIEPTQDAATTATPSEAAEAQADADESEDSMTTTTTDSMSDATTTQATDMNATATAADQTGVTSEATAATTAAATPPAAPTMPAGTAMGGPSNWAEFDGDSDGNLTPLEFGKLVMDAKGQPVGAEVDATLRSRESNLPSVQVLNGTSAELARIDTDRNWMVSQAELQAYQPE